MKKLKALKRIGKEIVDGIKNPPSRFLFGIDRSPRVGTLAEDGETWIEEPVGTLQGWVFHPDDIVRLQVLIDEKIVWEANSNKPRLDVFRIHRTSYNSLASGFEIEFPYTILPKISSGRLEVRAVADNQSVTLWQWENTVQSEASHEAQSKSEAEMILALHHHYSCKGSYAVKDCYSSIKTSKILPVIRTQGQLHYLLDAFNYLANFKSTTKQLVVLKSVDVAESEVRHVFSVSELAKSKTLTLINDGENFSWRDSLKLDSPENTAVFFTTEDINHATLNLSELCESLAASENFRAAASQANPDLNGAVLTAIQEQRAVAIDVSQFAGEAFSPLSGNQVMVNFYIDFGVAAIGSDMVACKMHSDVGAAFENYVRQTKHFQPDNRNYVAGFFNPAIGMFTIRIEDHKPFLVDLAAGKEQAREELLRSAYRYHLAVKICNSLIKQDSNKYKSIQLLAESNDRLVVAKLLGFPRLVAMRETYGRQYVTRCHVNKSDVGSYYYDPAFGIRIITPRTFREMLVTPGTSHDGLKSSGVWAGNREQLLHSLKQLGSWLELYNRAGTPEARFLITGQKLTFLGQYHDQRGLTRELATFVNSIEQLDIKLWKEGEVPQVVAHGLLKLIGKITNSNPNIENLDQNSDRFFVHALSRALKYECKVTKIDLGPGISTPLKYISGGRTLVPGTGQAQVNFFTQDDLHKELIRWGILHNKNFSDSFPDWVSLLTTTSRLPLVGIPTLVHPEEYIPPQAQQSLVLELGNLCNLQSNDEFYSSSSSMLVVNKPPYTREHLLALRKQRHAGTIQLLTVCKDIDCAVEILNERVKFQHRMSEIITSQVLPDFEKLRPEFSPLSNVDSNSMLRDLLFRPYIPGKRLDLINLCDVPANYLLRTDHSSRSLAFRIGRNVLGPAFFLGSPEIDPSKIIIDDEVFSINSATLLTHHLLEFNPNEEVSEDIWQYSQHSARVIGNFIAFVVACIERSQTVDGDPSSPSVFAVKVQEEILKGFASSLRAIPRNFDPLSEEGDDEQDMLTMMASAYKGFASAKTRLGIVGDLPKGLDPDKLRTFYEQLMLITTDQLDRFTHRLQEHVINSRALYPSLMVGHESEIPSETYGLLRAIFAITQRYLLVEQSGEIRTLLNPASCDINKPPAHEINFQNYTLSQRAWFLSVLDVSYLLKRGSKNAHYDPESAGRDLVKGAMGDKIWDLRGTVARDSEKFASLVAEHYSHLQIDTKLASDLFDAINGLVTYYREIELDQVKTYSFLLDLHVIKYFDTAIFQYLGFRIDYTENKKMRITTKSDQSFTLGWVNQ